jgi:sarcosine oxidase subunit delta
MLLIKCPYCEMERPEVEFRYAGEAHVARPLDPAAQSDADWAGYLFLRSNPKGLHFERWHHVHGCARFFNVARDTVSDRILATYKAGEPKPDPAALAAPEAAP